MERKARPAAGKGPGKTDRRNTGAIRVESPSTGEPLNAMDNRNWILAARERLSDLPAVRPEKIREAEKRVREGFYDRPEVVSKIVDRFLEEMGFC